MTDTVYAGATEERPLFGIREQRDKRALDAALTEDRAYAAYALGHLERRLFERARFWTAEGEGGAGVVMHATAMGQTMVVGGDPAAIDAILSLHPGPRTTYLSTCAPEHLAVVERTHALSATLRMTRMSVTRAAFSPATGAVRRLIGGDIRMLNALYALEDAPSYYTAEHIELGVYCGAFEDGRLIAVAGTHVVAPNVAIAVVGNVFTHPAWRGRGLATAVTSGVTEELLDRGCALVALTVDPANTSAVRAYSRLGYAAGATVIEARAGRRDSLGLGPWLRRRAARRRAAHHDGTAEEWTRGRAPADDGRSIE